jgi:hypothetical protein
MECGKQLGEVQHGAPTNADNCIRMKLADVIHHLVKHVDGGLLFHSAENFCVYAASLQLLSELLCKALDNTRGQEEDALAAVLFEIGSQACRAITAESKPSRKMQAQRSNHEDAT